MLVIPVSLVVTLWRASSLFREIIDALNRISDGRESRPFWKVWLVSFMLTFVQALIVFLAMVAIVAWPQIMALVGLTTHEASLVGAVKWLVLFVMIMLSFAMTFHAGPGAISKHKWVTPGTLFGTFAFLGSTSLLRVYLQNYGSYETAFGTLGGFFVLMFWFWVTSFVLLIAAEMNRIAQYASQKHEEFTQSRFNEDAENPGDAGQDSAADDSAGDAQLPADGESCRSRGSCCSNETPNPAGSYEEKRSSGSAVEPGETRPPGPSK